MEDTTMGATTETKVDVWNTTYFVPSQTTTTTTVGSETAKSVTTYGFTDHGSKKFFAYPTTTVDTDYEGNVATTTRQYHTTLGYQTEEKTVYNSSGTIDASNTLGFTYNYNAQGLLQSTVYPGNITVGYAYDGYGNLESVTAGNTKVWEFASNNGLRYTATLGGTLTSVEERNSQGLLTSQQMLKGTTVLHNMGYTFNGSTGNLTSRSGMLGQTETFGYDSVDRLTSVQHGSTTAMTLSYGANGNITSKTGIGTYSYGSKPHAVTSVTNSGSLIDSNPQSITYTAFDKAASINQSGYQLDITYGTDLQRWKSVLKNNGTVTRTILYAGDYEKVTENGVTKQYYYLHGGNGLAALYVKQSNASDKVYYPCTDHLGSIVKLVDANGTEAFKATYDAWGQQTVTTNTLNFHRGYTGHEHLSQFALINMNGRMYDPLLGRFLSPDPFVQLPDFSQNFNRYSYCLNNPLVYVDPDGEFVWAYVGIAAGVSAIMNVSANFEQIMAAGGGWASVWKGVQYAAVGAAAGATAAIVGPAVASSIGVGGVLGGAITGLVSGAAGGFVNGGGNALVGGGDWSDFWNGATQSAVTGGLYSAAFGGIIGGVDAFNNGTNVWTGKEIELGRNAFSLNNEPVSTATRHRPAMTAPDAMPAKSIPNKQLKASTELPTRITSERFEYTIRTNYNPISNIEGRSCIISRPGIKGYDKGLTQTDVYHNFPSSFDELIIQEGVGYIPQGNSSMFYAPGTINGKNGVYTIGINNQTGIIYHRAFYEWNNFIKQFKPYK